MVKYQLFVTKFLSRWDLWLELLITVHLPIRALEQIFLPWFGFSVCDLHRPVSNGKLSILLTSWFGTFSDFGLGVLYRATGRVHPEDHYHSCSSAECEIFFLSFRILAHYWIQSSMSSLLQSVKCKLLFLPSRVLANSYQSYVILFKLLFCLVSCAWLEGGDNVCIKLSACKQQGNLLGGGVHFYA